MKEQDEPQETDVDTLPIIPQFEGGDNESIKDYVERVFAEQLTPIFDALGKLGITLVFDMHVVDRFAPDERGEAFIYDWRGPFLYTDALAGHLKRMTVASLECSDTTTPGPTTDDDGDFV